MKECIPNKRKIEDNNTNKKKVSLSLRRTRLKKEVSEINLLNVITHDEKKIDIKLKQDNEDIPCLLSLSTDSVKIKQEVKLEELNMSETITRLKEEQTAQFPVKQESNQEDLCLCIICGKDIYSFDLYQKQKHVNECLDIGQSSAVESFNQDNDQDFSTCHIISKSNRTWTTKKEDLNDEFYQTTLALSKSLHKPDKKVKIELNEANIWSNEESRAEASNKLFDLLEVGERQLTQQLERERSIGYMKPSQFYTLQSNPLSYWELAALPECCPILLTCLFLNKLEK